MNKKNENNLSLAPKPIKPLDAISHLITTLSAVALPLSLKRPDYDVKLIDTLNGELHVVILLEGSVDCWRTVDNILLETANAPFILGVQGSETRYHHYKVIGNRKTVLRSLPLKQALEIIHKNNLWEDIFLYQNYLTDYQVYRDIMLINGSSYQVICTLLMDLVENPDHEEISIAKYIHSRTQFARSGILKIISDLRQGGYINVEQGKLISIQNKFPAKY